MRYLLALLLALPAFAQLGFVWIRDTTGFCTITNATNDTPIQITVADVSKCTIANGTKVLTDGIMGNTIANVHAGANNTEDEYVVFTVGGLSGNTFNLLTRTGGNTVGTADGSCGGAASTHAGTCAYVRGGRVGRAVQYTRVTGPIGHFDGNSGPRTAAYVASPKANSANPSYDVLLTDATAYETNYGSIWGFEQLLSSGTGGGVGSGGGFGRMTLQSALKWKLTANAASLTLVKWAIDNPEMLLGTTACDETLDGCSNSASGMMDYTKEGAQNLLQAYSIVEDQLTTGQKQHFAKFFLNDHPWHRGGIGFTGANLTKPVFTKLHSTSGGTLTGGTGTNVSITGSGTTLTSQCAIGGMLVENQNYALPLLITAIPSNTSMTVSVNTNTMSGSGFACGPRWTDTQLGWRYFHSHYSFGTLNGSEELYPYFAPPDNGHNGSPYFPTNAGIYNNGFNNHSHTRTAADLKAGLTLCSTELTACVLAEKADAYLNDVTLPAMLSVWTPASWNGNTYQADRMLKPMLDWRMWRVNSLTSAPDPFAGTKFVTSAIDWAPWFTAPRFFPVPNGDYGAHWLDMKQVRASMLAMTNSPTSVSAQNLFWFLTTKNWDLARSAGYADGGAIISENANNYLSDQYLGWEPGTTSTPITDTTKFFEPDLAACIAKFTASRCADVDVRNMVVSRTNWGMDSETYFFGDYSGMGVRDHQGDVIGGYFHLVKNGQWLVGGDGRPNDGTEGPMGWTGTPWRSRGIPLIGSTDGTITFSLPHGTPLRWRSGDNNFMHARVDLTDLYGATSAATLVERQNFHLKGGTNDYIVDHVKAGTSSAKSFQGPYHFNLNGCGTPNSTSCVALDNTAKTAIHTQTTAGKTARLSAKVIGISGTMNITTEDADLTHGAYTGGGGYSFRWYVTPAAGNVTDAEYVTVMKPSTSTSDTLPTINYATVGSFRTLEILDGTDPKFLAFTVNGATASTASFTTTHSGTARYLIAGLTPGTYNRCTVLTGENTCSFASTSGTITVSSANSWYVAVGGSGSGSIGSPWALSTALSGASGAILPGDTVYLRAGTYGGHNVATLSGSAGNQITFRPYQPSGQAIEAVIFDRAALTDGDNASLKVDAAASYLTFRDLEFTNSNTDRRSAFDTSNPTDMRPNGFESFGHHIQFINNVIHNTGTGLSAWSTGATADASLFYGNLLFGNGWQSANPAERGHGHGVYMQNQATGSKTLRENVSFWNFNQGAQLYGSGDTGVYISGFTLDGNAAFMNGMPSLPGLDRQILVGAGQFCSNNTLTGNKVYTPIGSALQAMNLGYQNALSCRAYTVTNNYLIGGELRIVKQRSTSPTADSTFSGKTATFGNGGGISVDTILSVSGSTIADCRLWISD